MGSHLDPSARAQPGYGSTDFLKSVKSKVDHLRHILGLIRNAGTEPM
jgi:hypothetical protein